MQQFLVLTVGRALDPQDGDEQTQAYMGEWQAWLGGLVASGALDSGRPLEPGGKVVDKGGINDYVPEEIGVGGYLIINAESLEDAARIAQGSPHIAIGGSAIIRPCLSIPQE